MTLAEAGNTVAATLLDGAVLGVQQTIGDDISDLVEGGLVESPAGQCRCAKGLNNATS